MTRTLHYALFFVLMSAVTCGAHYYVYRRITAMAGVTGAAWRRRILAAAMALGLSFPAARLMILVSSGRFIVAFDWFANLWAGVFLYALLATAAIHLAGALFGIFNRHEKSGPAAAVRRGRITAVFIGVFALTMGIYGFCAARFMVQTTVLDLPVKGLPAALDGFRVVQVSDIHIGVIVRNGKVRDLVEKINSLSPDLVVITGDLADEDASYMKGLSGELARIKSVHGTLACTGNHDYYAGVEHVTAIAAGAGIRFLRNEKATVAGAIDVYGIDDLAGRYFGEKTPEFGSIIGPGARTRPTILLYHQPVGMEKAAALGVDIVLSGHTHKGQIWPITLISRLIYRYQTGLFKSGDTAMYVSRGAGTWGPPMRVGSTPEIVLVRLRARA
ncbi:MAG: metallophosphoesterase [Myxococcota bacterium]|jgi:hypothetical protein